MSGCRRALSVYPRPRVGRALVAAVVSVALAVGLVPGAAPVPTGAPALMARATGAPRPGAPLARALPRGPLVAAQSRSAPAPGSPRATAIPAGNGPLQLAVLPAPWRLGHIASVRLGIYLPAGYASSGLRYPVVYAVPWDVRAWDVYGHVVQVLDQSVHRGLIPPEIVVFVNLSGGPYPTSECADSAGGLQRADTFVTRTVVQWIDRHMRTLDRPTARTLLGFSQGGFCAANLLLRHPETFASAIAFDGYYLAGLRSAETATARYPWGDDAALIAANSPLVTAARVAASTRSRLFLVLSANPRETLYGAQATAFARRLEQAGISYQALWTPLGHRWKAVSLLLPAALAAVAAHQLSLPGPGLAARTDISGP